MDDEGGSWWRGVGWIDARVGGEGEFAECAEVVGVAGAFGDGGKGLSNPRKVGGEFGNCGRGMWEERGHGCAGLGNGRRKLRGGRGDAEKVDCSAMTGIVGKGGCWRCGQEVRMGGSPMVGKWGE